MVVVRPLLNTSDLAAWAHAEGFHGLRPSAWHVTIVNTRRRPALATLVPDLGEMIVTVGEREVLRLGPFIALMIASEALAARHQAFLAAGGEYDHHRYRPHVTFSVNGPRDLSGVTPYAGELRFGAEVWE